MTQIIGFSDIAAALSPSGNGYEGHIPDEWRQGRTAYGGLTAGLALSAAQTAFPDLPPLRSVLVNFIGPVIGDPVFTPSILRQGKNVTSINVDVTAGEAIVARVSLVFGQSRDSALSVNQSEPVEKSPEDCELFTPKAFEAFVPKFFLQFDTRLISGARPMSGAKEGYINCWSRHKHEGSRTGIASLLTIGDVLPPAALPMFTSMGPVSSVTWMLNLLTDDPITDDGWWRLDTRQTAASHGYSSQQMGIWNKAGELVAEGMQSVAVFV